MKQGTILFLRAVLVLIGIGAFAFLLWEPHIEGRNANATPFEIYFKDPFLAYAYIASVPFFVGLYQAFKVVEYAARGKKFSPSGARSLRTIKYCAFAIIGFVAVGEIFIIFGSSDDRAGGVFIGLLITIASILVATAMVVLERAIQNAAEINSENDLEVSA